jgi:hypothetical protein
MTRKPATTEQIENRIIWTVGIFAVAFFGGVGYVAFHFIYKFW